VKRNLKSVFRVTGPRLLFRHALGTSITLILLAGCGSHTLPHSSELVFKGEVVKVDYMLTHSITILMDRDGKTTTLAGFPSVPCSEVEIYHRGHHDYQVFQAKEPIRMQ